MRSYLHARVLLAALPIAMAGCQGYVKKTDFEQAVGALLANELDQQAEIENLSMQMQMQTHSAIDTAVFNSPGWIASGDVIVRFTPDVFVLRDVGCSGLNCIDQLASSYISRERISMQCASSNDIHLQIRH